MSTMYLTNYSPYTIYALGYRYESIYNTGVLAVIEPNETALIDSNKWYDGNKSDYTYSGIVPAIESSYLTDDLTEITAGTHRGTTKTNYSDITNKTYNYNFTKSRRTITVSNNIPTEKTLSYLYSSNSYGHIDFSSSYSYYEFYTNTYQTEPIKYNINKTLTNCTISPTDDTISENTETTFTVTANDGYQFYTPPTINGAEMTKTSDTIYTATITITSDTAIIANAEQTIISYNINKTLTNCTISPTSDTIAENTETTFTVTANDGYQFYTTPTINSTEMTKTSDSIYTATITVTSDITIIANAEKTKSNIRVYVGTATNCTFEWTPTGETQVEGTEITCTATANTGYYFETAPTARHLSDLGGNVYIDFTLINNKTATLTITLESNWSILSFDGTAILQSDIPTISTPFINAYVLTSEQLLALEKTRFVVADTSSPYNIVDLGTYITSLKRLYCNVETSLDTKVTLATIQTEVNAKIIASDFTVLNCGEITIESTNNNSNDYSNVTIEILLPFIGTQTLEPDKIMNRTITLEYKISNISGDCVAIIKEGDTILYTFTGNISDSIPYILNNINWDIRSSFDFNSTVLYGFTPTILIVYHDNYNENNTALINNNLYCQLSTLSGICYVDNVIINNAVIPSDEQELITTTLRNGVNFTKESQ